MVARLLWEQDAAGSSPVTSTIILSNRIVMRFVLLLTAFLLFRFKKIVEYAYSTSFFVWIQVRISVTSNLNINVFEPSCVLLYVEKS